MTRIPLSAYNRMYRSPYDPLTEQYLMQDALARQENEQRYLDLVSGRQGTRERIMGDLAGFGQSQLDDANRRADINTKNDTSYLTSRGLGASNIVAGTRRQNDEQRQRELNRINDDIINRRVGTDAQLSDSLHSLIERRNDMQPDPNQLARLSQGLGQAGYGYNGSVYNAQNYAQPNVPMVGGRPSPAMGLGATGGRTPYIAGSYAAPLQGWNLPGGRHGLTEAPMTYTPPGTTPGGYDDQFSNALSRYQGRMSASYADPYSMYGGVAPLPPRVGQSANVGGYVGTPAGSPANGSVPWLQQQGLKEQYAARDNAAYQERFGLNSPYQQFSNFKSNPIARQYPGWGANMWNEQPAQIAPATRNLGYGNPSAQLGQIQAGALAGAGDYTTMGDVASSYRGRPFRSSRSQVPRAVRAASSAMLPFSPFNPYSLLR